MKTIRVPAPIADDGDFVEALNYRRRPPVWEACEVVGLELSRWLDRNTPADEVHYINKWSYRVLISERDGLPCKPVFLVVGDNGIRQA